MIGMNISSSQVKVGSIVSGTSGKIQEIPKNSQLI